MVIIGMGEKGVITRVAAPMLGAEFTFASAETGKETAPGQISKERLSVHNQTNTGLKILDI